MPARRLLPLALLLAAALHAHVGSPDVFYEGAAGPYRLLVTIRPPVIVPGVAEIEIRSSTPGVSTIRIVPLPLTGPGAKLAPTADIARQSKEDPQFFTGALWLMSVGAWQVRIHAEGDQGSGERCRRRRKLRSGLTFSSSWPTISVRTRSAAWETALFAHPSSIASPPKALPSTIISAPRRFA